MFTLALNEKQQQTFGNTVVIDTRKVESAALKYDVVFGFGIQ